MNPAGQLVQETLGNGVVVNRSLDAVTGRPSSINAGVGGGAALQNNSYLFDDAGNLTQRQENIAGVTENVFPDALNRLDHTVGDSNTVMQYDGIGRISAWGNVGAANNTNDYTTAQAGCTYYANPQIHAVRQKTQGTGVASYCYDANGNETSSTWRGALVETNTWTSYNQPNLMTGGFPTIGTSTSTSQFFYNHNHQRWKQIASYSGAPQTTQYIGDLLEKVTNATVTAYRYYVPAGNNTIVYNRLSSGTNTIAYLTKDHLGSTAVITDSSGNLVVREKYAALGWTENTAAENDAKAGITRRGFTGQEGLDNAGLWMVNMNARIYVPAGSMFLSPDPTIADPTSTLSYNRYSYAYNNPLRYTDPTGYCGVDEATGDVTVCPRSDYWSSEPGPYNYPGLSPGEDGGRRALPVTAQVAHSSGRKDDLQTVCVGAGCPDHAPLIGFQGPVADVELETELSVLARVLGGVGMLLFPSPIAQDRDRAEFSVFHYTSNTARDAIIKAGAIVPGRDSKLSWVSPTAYCRISPVRTHLISSVEDHPIS